MLSTDQDGSDYDAVTAEWKGRSELNISVLPSVQCLCSNPSVSESPLWRIKVRKASAKVF